jgi:hypothetical protein
MKRRNFFEISGCRLAALLASYWGFTSCKKGEVPPVSSETEATAIAEGKARAKTFLMDKMKKTEEEAEAMLADFEAKLPEFKAKCLCRGCPTYVRKETRTAFCHAFVGKSKIISQQKGCDCPECPIHKEAGLKNGYYCLRGTELEQEAAKQG